MPEGLRVALSGPNGSGKSTLLQILAGRLAPEGGLVSVPPTGLRLVGQFAGPEALSGGEARLKALRAAFDGTEAFLLLDEPSNDLDAEARVWLRGEIRRCRKGLLAVSHDPLLLDAVDEIWELRAGAIQRHPPGYEAYAERLRREEERLRESLRGAEASKRAREATARESRERQQKRQARGEKQGLRQNLPRIVRGAKKRQAERSLARIEATHERIVDAEIRRVAEAKTRLRQLSLFRWDARLEAPANGQRVLRVEGFRLREGSAPPLSFEMHGAARLRLAGRNGTGKSTLLQALGGDARARARCEGRLQAGVPFGVFDQRLAGFVDPRPLWQTFAERSALPPQEARALLGRLGFEQEEQQRPQRALSGGERMRLELARLLSGSPAPRLLLLDEPTNHLDPEGRRILVDFLRGYPGALLVVSHDERFVAELELAEAARIGTPP